MPWRSALGVMLSLALQVGGRAEANCLSYGGRVQLEGVLTFREYPGPPNFDDKSPPLTLWFIELPEPICVDPDPIPGNAEINVAARDLREIQIVAGFPPGYGAFKPFRGRRIRVSGELRGRIGAQRKTPVFLDGARIEQPAKSGAPVPGPLSAPQPP